VDAVVDTTNATAVPFAPRFARGKRIDFAFLVRTLHRQKGLVGTVLAGGLAATLIALLLVAPRYKATASILLDPRQESALSSNVPQQSGNNEATSMIESQLELLRSARVASRVIKELEAGGVASFGTDSTSGKNVQLADASSTAQMRTPPVSPDQVEEILRGLTIERQGRSYVVELSYTDRSAEKAAKVTNAFIDAYLADQLETKFAATRTANLWLKDQVRDIKHDIDEIEHRRQKFRSEGHPTAVGDMTLLEKEILQYTQQLISARAHAAEAEAQLKQVRALAQDPQQVLSPDAVLQSTVISDYRRQAAEIQRRIDQSISRYGEQHADVLSAKAELGNLNKEVEREIGRIVESKELAYTSATEQAKLLEGELQKLKDSAVKFGEYQIKLGEFNREIAVSRDLYANLLRRYKETSAQVKLQGSGVSVVAYAAPPRRAAYPKKTLALLLSSLAWLGLGVGLGVRRELNHSKLRTRADVEEGLGVQCVSTLPVMDFSTCADDEQQSLAGPVHWRVDEKDQEGAYCQSIYALKQWIEKLDGPSSRVVLMVSAHPAAGCSTVAAQLALYAASAGTRTILVDADLRSRGLSSVWPSHPKYTLIDVLMHGAEAKSAISQIPGLPLWFCSAPADGNCRPLNVLGARPVKDFFRTLREGFDLIIVDTPPMASYVDATALVAYADCVLVVVKACQTQEVDVTVLLNQLDAEPETDVGVVLNMTKPGQGG
jgi:succinoglycan biosynthesis transport protein ExoP